MFYLFKQSTRLTYNILSIKWIYRQTSPNLSTRLSSLRRLHNAFRTATPISTHRYCHLNIVFNLNTPLHFVHDWNRTHDISGIRTIFIARCFREVTQTNVFWKEFIKGNKILNKSHPKHRFFILLNSNKYVTKLLNYIL